MSWEKVSEDMASGIKKEAARLAISVTDYILLLILTQMVTANANPASRPVQE